MPTYDFQCQACQNEFEDIIKMDDPFPNCPKCNSTEIKRLISYATPGKVEISADQIDAEIKKGGQEILNKAASNENYMANLVGDGKYQNNTIQRQEAKKYLNSEKKGWRRV